MNTLYFSRKCSHCKEFIVELKKLGMVRDFKYVCVDGNRNLPNFVREIPTIQVQDYKDEQTGQLVPISGNHAFKWIDYVKKEHQKQKVQQEVGPELDGFGFGGFGSSFNDINATSNVAQDGDLGGFSGLDYMNKTLIDPNMQNDPRINASMEQRMAAMKAERGM